MHHDLHINRLRTLITVVEQGGFRRAAEVLRITQPAVSQQIQKLSSLLEEPVFTSTGSTLRLSPAGEELLGYAHRLIALNDEAVSRLVRTKGNQRVALGVSGQLTDCLPRLFELLAQRAPHLRFTVHTEARCGLLGELDPDRLDMALLLNYDQQGTGYESHLLGHISLSWFGRPTFDQDGPLPLAMFTKPCSLRSHLLGSLTSSGIPWRIGYEGAEFVGLRAAVQAGLGFACLISNADKLWGLPRSTHAALPDPPPPVPVTLALTPSLSSILQQSTRASIRDVLCDYPLVPHSD